MFEFGFWEIVVIAIVALFVIGPERLPAVARTLGVWFGRIRGYMGSMQADFQQEIAKADELKRMIDSENQVAQLHQKLMSEVVDGRVPTSVKRSEDESTSAATATSDNVTDKAENPQQPTK